MDETVKPNPEVTAKVLEENPNAAFDEILKALGGQSTPKAGTPNERDKKPESPGDLPGEALIMLMEFANGKICRMYAAKHKVKWTDKLARQIAITATERAGLRTFAPYAADYLKYLLIHFPKIAAGLFLVTYWTILTDKFGVIKEHLTEAQKREIEEKGKKMEKEREEKK